MGGGGIIKKFLKTFIWKNDQKGRGCPGIFDTNGRGYYSLFDTPSVPSSIKPDTQKKTITIASSNVENNQTKSPQ